MYEGRRVLAVVPARSGSKRIEDKNVQEIQGRSLIGWAGRTLEATESVDRAIISTDAKAYAEEGRRHGLDAPFLRPDELAADDAGDVPTMQHAVEAVEDHDGTTYDIILMVQPTSPNRRPEDLEACIEKLVATGADSVVTVSPVDKKFHPKKYIALDGDRIAFLHPDGATVRTQELEPLHWRNGVCYAMTRACLMEEDAIFTDDTRAHVVERPVANVDTPVELAWAEFLMGWVAEDEP